MLTKVHIYEDDECDGSTVEFKGTDILDEDRFFIPDPRAMVLLEYVTRRCLKVWLATRDVRDFAEPGDSVRQMPSMAMRAINIVADKDQVVLEFVGANGELTLCVPYPAGRILLEHMARVCMEERVDMALVGRSSDTVFFPDEVLKDIKQRSSKLRNNPT
jgi:hypothetical protein